MSKKNEIGEAVKRQRVWRTWFSIAASVVLLVVAATLAWGIWEWAF